MRFEGALDNVLSVPDRLPRFCMRKIQGIPVYRKLARLFWLGIGIKEADEEDIRRFNAWFKRIGGRASISRDRNVTNLVAKRGSKVIGSVQLMRFPEGSPLYAGYWLFSLTVNSFYRGMGIGEKLSRVVIEKARAEGAEELLLRVGEDNHRAINLYRKLGFRIKAMPKLDEARLNEEMAPRGRRQIIMSKSLSEPGCI